MRIAKQILIYVSWTVTALLIALGYVHQLLGPVPDEDAFGGFWFIAQVFYGYGLLYVGLAIGGIVAILFILTDIFYLKNKLEDNTKRTLIRFLVLFIIMLLVGILHYILEKVVDVV